MIDVFILGYSGVNYFSYWHPQVEFADDVRFHYIDNGNQELTTYVKKYLVHVSSKNIFCSGGWNLICNIAFHHMKLEKIIIGQEDAIFTDDIVREVNELTNEKAICGTYDRSFEFSLFGLHRNTYENVGSFDENFILGGNEDNDYKHRCRLKDVDVLSLNVSADFNQSLTGSTRSVYDTINANYLHQKWGNHVTSKYKIYEFDIPFNGQQSFILSPQYRAYFNLKDSDPDIFMSEIEYEIFKNKNK